MPCVSRQLHLVQPVADMEYGVFSDESRYDRGRFRSIAAVSLPAGLVPQLTEQLTLSLREYGISELKWTRLGDRNYTVECAIAFVDHMLSGLAEGLRVDVLIWDTEDKRHRVENRDDIANYERMYFHLHRALIRRRGQDSIWHLRPDEQVQINWKTLASCLTSRGTWIPHGQQSAASFRFGILVPTISTFRQVDSRATPLSQLADLIAGMAAYTRSRPSVVHQQLEPEVGNEFKEFMSKRDKVRFRVISHLYNGCRLRRVGLSLRSHGYLCTSDPIQPVNFWHYQPQHSSDKAPVALSKK